jgi:hypothetical protein
LEVLEVVAGFDALEAESGIDVGQGLRAVDRRFSAAQHVQVGSVQDKYGGHREQSLVCQRVVSLQRSLTEASRLAIMPAFSQNVSRVSP